MQAKQYQILPTTAHVKNRLKDLPSNKWEIVSRAAWWGGDEVRCDIKSGEPAVWVRSVDVGRDGEKDNRWVAERNLREIE